MAEYIEREALYKWVLEFYPNDLKFASAVLNAPAAKVAEVRHGKWKFVECVELGLSEYMCSECGYNDIFINAGVHRGVYRYCPQCGARMDFGGVKNEN